MGEWISLEISLDVLANRKPLTQITLPVARSLQQLGYNTSTSQYKAHRITIHLKTFVSYPTNASKLTTQQASKRKAAI
jgi:hypothetical protein